jgi:hypothetical protein
MVMKTTQNEEPERPEPEDEQEKHEPFFGPRSIWGGVGGGAR